MADLLITATVMDTQNNTATVTGTASQVVPDVITTGGMSVNPQTAAPNTMRTFTFWALSSLSLPLSANITGSGVSFTPVSNPPPIQGMPAGAVVFAWTFTW